jgi:hypothetical protein
MTKNKSLDPIEQRIVENKKLVIDRLKINPIIQIACKKAGISRATYYRWKKDDPEFVKEANKALREGSELISDMAESQLINQIRDKNMTAIIFWLKHHRQAYETRLKVKVNSDHEESLTKEQQDLIERALAIANLRIKNEESTK